MLVIELLEASTNFVFLENTRVTVYLGNIHYNDTSLISLFIIRIAIGIPFVARGGEGAVGNFISGQLVEDGGGLVILNGGSALVVHDSAVTLRVGNASDSLDAIGDVLAINEELHVLHGVRDISEELAGRVCVECD